MPAAERLLDLFSGQIGSDWHDTILLTIAWLASEKAPGEAARVRNRVRSTQPSSPTPEIPQAPQAGPIRVQADSPAALLAIVPHLLGFAPQASLVVIGARTIPDNRGSQEVRFEGTITYRVRGGGTVSGRLLDKRTATDGVQSGVDIDVTGGF